MYLTSINGVIYVSGTVLGTRATCVNDTESLSLGSPECTRNRPEVTTSATRKQSRALSLE